MDKKDFQENTLYTLTIRDSNDKLRPANVYVHKLHENSMIIRMTDKSGELIKIDYKNVVKIVKEQKVNSQDHFHIPEALLLESHWKGRTSLNHYSSSPHMGK